MSVNVSVLVLNQNYEPLNVCGARRAVVLLLHEKAQMLQNGRGEFHTASAAYPIPTVIRLFHMVKRPLFIRRLSRREVFWRDDFTCQYCGTTTHQLTLDHVTPRVRGGTHAWENVVTACVPCNHRKAGRTPVQARMKLLREPRPPRVNPYHQFMHREIPDEWRPFLPWANGARPAASLA